MRRMAEEPDYGRNLAARARAFVEESLSPSRIGRKMGEYLVEPTAGQLCDRK